MKIIIVGCGIVGQAVGGLLAREPDVQEIICADAKIDEAKKLCSLIKTLNAKVATHPRQVDALDSESVSRAAKGCNLVFNMTYPNCNVPILKACMNVGAAYIDVLSFPPSPGMPAGTTIDDLLQLDAQAAKAGITAITNMGGAPGFSNMAAHYIINELDSASKVRFKWFDKVFGKDELLITWYPAGFLSEWLGMPPIVWEKGQFKEVDLLTSAEECDFPEPIGRQTVYTATFHPEIYMIPKYMAEGKGKSDLCCDLMGGMSVGNWKTKDLLLEAVRRQTLRTTIDQKVQSGQDLIELFAQSFSTPSVFYKEFIDKGVVTDHVGVLTIEVTGHKKGKTVVHTIFVMPYLKELQKFVPWSNIVGYTTSVCAEVVGLMILRGEIKQKGVLVPDFLDIAKALMDRMEQKGIKVLEKIEIA